MPTMDFEVYIDTNAPAAARAAALAELFVNEDAVAEAGGRYRAEGEAGCAIARRRRIGSRIARRPTASRSSRRCGGCA